LRYCILRSGKVGDGGKVSGRLAPLQSGTQECFKAEFFAEGGGLEASKKRGSFPKRESISSILGILDWKSGVMKTLKTGLSGLSTC